MTASRSERPGAKRPWRLQPELHSEEARRVAAVVLDVLAGVRTPADAASALAVSQPRYLALETRALTGMLAACERRGKGRRCSSEREIVELRRKAARLERESARNAALLRMAQRAFGLRAVEKPRPTKDARGRKRRKPSVRALRVATALRVTPTPVEVPVTEGDNGPPVRGAFPRDAASISP